MDLEAMLTSIFLNDDDDDDDSHGIANDFTNDVVLFPLGMGVVMGKS